LHTYDEPIDFSEAEKAPVSAVANVRHLSKMQIVKGLKSGDISARSVNNCQNIASDLFQLLLSSSFQVCSISAMRFTSHWVNYFSYHDK